MLLNNASTVCVWHFRRNFSRVRTAALRTQGARKRVIIRPETESAVIEQESAVGTSSQTDSTEVTHTVSKVPFEYKLYNTVLYAQRRKLKYSEYLNSVRSNNDTNNEFQESMHNTFDLSVAARFLLDESVTNDKTSVNGECSSSKHSAKQEDVENVENETVPPLQYPYAISQKSDSGFSRHAYLPASSTADEAFDAERRQTAESELIQKAEDRVAGLVSSLQKIGLKDERRLSVVTNDEEGEIEDEVFTKSQFGTPDPTVSPSSVECSGCGALLHCQSTGMPGYIPSELFVGTTKGQLRNLVCQRCHFLKEHDVALNVSVGPEEYPKLLKRIRSEVALVLLVVDLLDFPCSIWPGLVDIIGTNRPICVVGNKVDLLPRDLNGHLRRIQFCLENALKQTGVDTGKNIKHVCLVSAKSGYGIEELITAIQSKWGTKGDIYLVGCTNVGKSTLFNALLQSDLCKSQAVDIIQRATTSVWPGTTLNLLKFPLLRPSPHRVHLRMERLKEEHKQRGKEMESRREMFRRTKDQQYASLISHIGLTFFQPQSMFARKLDDGFSVSVKPNPSPASDIGKVFNPKDFDFAEGRWCYDTPGSVHEDQIISLLTLEELNLVLPKEFVHPKTFVMQPNSTFFLAGLGRIDYIEGNEPVCLTVFSAPSLPVSILPTVNAEEFYQKYFGTHVLKVPSGSATRLQEFPPLQGKEVVFTGTERKQSCADIVLSSAGWVAITAPKDKVVKFKAYTPAGRGCYFRQPAILPHAVKLRGKRLKFTPCYKNDKLVTNY